MTTPPWMTKANRLRQQNRRAHQQEARTAQTLGGKVQGGSGSSWRAPRDVKTSDSLVECKYTDGTTYTINALDWLRYRKDALLNGREPELLIEFPRLNLRLRITEDE